MTNLSYVIVAVAAYLLGSLPTGFLVARAKGIDIRTVGSKNMGATNVFRTVGKGLGILVLIVDALKGFTAVALVMNFYHELNALLPKFFLAEVLAYPSVRMNYGVLAGIFAVLGHNYTCWLGFKGGKGIATTAGVYVALAPPAVGIALATWIIVVVLTRYVSIASIAAAVALPTAIWLMSDHLLLQLVTTALGIMAIVNHKKNIQRLLAGTESRFGKKSPSVEGAK